MTLNNLPVVSSNGKIRINQYWSEDINDLKMVQRFTVDIVTNQLN